MPQTIANIREDRSYHKLHVFLYDFRNYRYRSNDSSDTAARLKTLVSEYYLGGPYFSDGEAQMLRNTVIEGGG